LQLVEREFRAARPHQGRHIEPGRGVALDRDALMPAAGVGAAPQAARPHAPAELPGLSEGLRRHENRVRTSGRFVKCHRSGPVAASALKESFCPPSAIHGQRDRSARLPYFGHPYVVNFTIESDAAGWQRRHAVCVYFCWTSERNFAESVPAVLLKATT
jgi:hypothetical protein